jgi:hypothetical protein
MFLPMAVFSPEKHDSNVDGNIGQWEQFSKPNKLRLLMDLIKGWAQPLFVQLFGRGPALQITTKRKVPLL